MSVQLLGLASDKSAKSRDTLLVALTDMYVQGIERRTPSEAEIFGEVALLLYQEISEKSRAALSTKLAPFIQTPLPLAMAFATDAIRVATPVLEKYPGFQQEHLEDLAGKLDDSHLQVLSRRDDLGQKASQILAERGSKVVRRILAGNREIELSRLTLRALVKHAIQDIVLREDLALRADLTPSICQMLLPSVTGETAAHLKKMINGSITQEDLDQIGRLRQVRRKIGVNLDNPDVAGLLRFCKQNDISADDLSVLLVQDKRLSHATDLLAFRCGIPPVTARNALFNGDRDDVIGMARKAGMSLDAFSMLAKARCDHLRIPMSQAGDWIAAYVQATGNNRPQLAQRARGEFAAKRKPKLRNGQPRTPIRTL
ncbi:DUF2336 domain-containing protein [Roseibium suaedae]|uniref:Uncharacterized conserved protein, DUF2336 family n=1 Tax=Roseibium suaedae TaxID=735517 RepID=A0A1M7IIL9_9HYPH|nr:DUF2336 domain-containing protein [Roseibium suaedae]SHM40277.1 Uncharacterized conserved protein, DUF2336 family [Roseibium suaedae]